MNSRGDRFVDIREGSLKLLLWRHHVLYVDRLGRFRIYAEASPYF